MTRHEDIEADRARRDLVNRFHGLDLVEVSVGAGVPLDDLRAALTAGTMDVALWSRLERYLQAVGR